MSERKIWRKDHRTGPEIVDGQVNDTANLKLLFLPPYSPELNPQEHVWDELQEKCFHNKTFDSLNLLEDHLVTCSTRWKNNMRPSRILWLGLDY
jgi:transposase